MKPHFLVKLGQEVPVRRVPHWITHIQEPESRSRALTPAVDRVVAAAGIPVWVTHEYRPRGRSWNEAEVAAGLDRIYRLVLEREGTVPAAMLRQIELLPVVDYARRWRVGSASIPTRRATALASLPSRWARDVIRLPEAHMYTQGDPGVSIAVLDTGVDLDHPELRGVLNPGFDFVDVVPGGRAYVRRALAGERPDDGEQFVGDASVPDDDPSDEQGHGTHVAGILVARGQRMPTGVAPSCRLVPVRVLATFRQRSGRTVGAGVLENINAGVKWAVDQGVRVINMSLGIRHQGGGLPHAEVVDYAKRMGVTIVAASGNDGQEHLYYPGALEHVIAVGSVGYDGHVSPFSTTGAQVDCVAPGEEIYSSIVNGYDSLSGTSQATPFVTGTVALLHAYARKRGFGELSDPRVKHLLKRSADRLGRALKTRKSGYGRVNAADALRLLDHKRPQVVGQVAA